MRLKIESIQKIRKKSKDQDDKHTIIENQLNEIPPPEMVWWQLVQFGTEFFWVSGSIVGDSYCLLLWKQILG